MTVVNKLKNNIVSVLTGAVKIGSKFKNVLMYPLVFSLVVVLYVGSSRLLSGESLLILAPLLLPAIIITVALWVIHDVVSIKDSVDEVAESLSALNELKSLDLKDPGESKVKLKANSTNIVKLVSAVGGVTVLKDSPVMVKDAIGAVKGLVLLANPVSLLLILFGIVVLWMYSSFLLLNAFF